MKTKITSAVLALGMLAGIAGQVIAQSTPTEPKSPAQPQQFYDQQDRLRQ